MQSKFDTCFKLYLTHIASQLLYRYLPSAIPRILTHCDTRCWMDSAKSLSEADWRYQAIDWGQWYGLNAKDSADTQFWDTSSFLEALAVAAQRHLHLTFQAKAHLLFVGDYQYPSLLKEISDPPWVLTFWGNPEILSRQSISLVGARKASPYALQQSEALGELAANSGLVVVSGGAFGCDIFGHRGVLRSQVLPCPAIVVMASGLSSLYPRANHPWFREIFKRGGVILSERLWWAPCRPADFLIRNRIVSGLSATTCIMEATKKSGAMTTARFALDQGRDVYVLQGDKSDVRSEGNRGLIDEGALAFSESVCLFAEGLLH